MKMIGIAAASIGALFATAAFAQTNKMEPAGVKLSASECTSLWQQANPNNAPGVTESQAAPYVTNFKAANPDGDTTLEQDEWMAACNKGMIKSSSASGSSSGASGSSGSSQ
jgi:hypothetical protein